MLKEDTDRQNNYNNTNWASHVKEILDSHGLGNIWLQQFEIQIPLNEIKQRILDTYYQSWNADISNSQRLSTYSTIKHTFEQEKYLNCIQEKKYRIAYSRLRVSSHNLAIESGRYTNIPREHRICTFCIQNLVENEYHMVLVCPFYRDLRVKYLKPYYCRWPTINKFKSLLTSNSPPVIKNLAKFIYLAMKRRQ